MKKETIQRIRQFTTDRDWDRFHSPANLAKSISIEANELLECFQWSDTDFDIEAVKEELADVLVYCRNMLDKLELDEDEIVNKKMDKNEEKYPVSLSKGNAKKYTQLVNETGEIIELDSIDLIILNCVKSVGTNYGIEVICSILHGGEGLKIARHELNKTPYYCALKMKSSKKETTNRIKRLIDNGYLLKTHSFYPCVGLSKLGDEVLNKKAYL